MEVKLFPYELVLVFVDNCLLSIENNLTGTKRQTVSSPAMHRSEIDNSLFVKATKSR